jgi:hypothetical protein
MAMRKSYTESLSVKGAPDDWFPRCVAALSGSPFLLTEQQPSLRSMSGRYRALTRTGAITVNLHPQGEDTRIEVSVAAAVDNIYAVFSSPGQRILQDFRSRLVGGAS